MSTELFDDEVFEKEQDAISAKKAFGMLIPFLKKHKARLIFSLLLMIISIGLTIYWPILVKKAIDIDIGNGDYGGLLTTVLIIGLIQAVSLILLYIQRVKLEIIGQDVMLELKTRLFSHVLSLNISYFDTNPVGRLMARVESDTESLRMLFTNTVVMLIGDVVMVLGVFGVMFYHSWRLTLILLPIFPSIFVLLYIFEKKTTPRFLEVRKKVADLTGVIAEFISGISIIQIFNRESWATKKVDNANRIKFDHDVYVNIAVVLFFNIILFSQHLMIGMVIYFGMLWIKAGTVTVGTFGMFILLIWKSYEPIYRSTEQFSVIQKAIAGTRRIFALMDNKQIIPEPSKPVRWRELNDRIKFEKVWFSYTDDDNYVLKDISFEIPRGKRIALAGVTGGGKSTIISLILRLYDPQKGRITVDGIDIRDIHTAELRERFALVLQDIFLFPGDVRSNVSLESKHITEEKIIEAAKTVDAHKFISRLPKGYETEISEKGANFSRGERQLLSFARAMAVDPDILILDEATSSVDPETERTIQESLGKLMDGRTSLIIAHRLSTILDSDEILVIRRGEIIERGSHIDLLLKDGYYARLFHLQFKNKNGMVSNVK
ncbi:MAG: ABC transporter ATP-binding protein [candidate division Zixibacteria bacterium]